MTDLVRPEDPNDLISKEYVEKAQRLFKAALNQKAESTVRAYESSIANFAKYMEISDPKEALGYLLSLSRLDAELRVMEYLGWMEEKELAPSTIRVRLSGLKFYVKTAYRAQWIDWTLETEGPRQENVKDVVGPTPAEFRVILDVVDDLDGKVATRNRALVYMLSFMALRISECLTLDMEHVDLKKGTVNVKRKGSRRKRDKRTVPTKTLEAMVEWTIDRGPQDGPFFSNMDLREDKAGARLHRSTAWKFIRKIGEKAGVPHLHPHAFRHFSTTEALEITDGNTRETMKHTGHKSERMVSVYEDKRKDVAGDIAQRIEDRWMSDEEE
jgi:integrase/recombinase XerC